MEVCYNCFGTKITSGRCSLCGYDPTGAEKKSPMALRPGSILNGRYVVGRVLGQGGFGITYIALDDQRQQRVAIKEYLPSEYAGRNMGTYLVTPYSEEREDFFRFGMERFLEEAKTLAAFIGDEHIVRIYSYFEENGTAYFAMEYVEGMPLDKYMATKGGRLTVEEADELLLPLMEALDVVHSKGIVHRDIAPDNIIITPEHTAKLLDFGAARYSTGEKSKSLDVVIKHGFAPYEQYMRRGRQGPFTDVYAMGATYYYAITGKIPPDAVERRAEDELIPPSNLGVKINAAAEEALYKALEVTYGDRFQTMGAFHDAMLAAQGESRRKQEREEKEAQEWEHLAREAEERAQREKEATEKARAEQERREKEAAKKARQPRTETQETAEPQPEKRKSSSRTLPLIAAVAALVIGALIFFAGRGGKAAEPPAAVPENEVVTEATTEVPTAEELPAIPMNWTLEDGVLTISGQGPMETQAFDRESVRSAVIEEGITTISKNAFFHCRNLASVTIPQSVTDIDVGAFDGCGSLTSVTIPESVTSIGSSAFSRCSSLTSVTIPESVTSIDSHAFSRCVSLESITIPESVENLGSNVFYACESLGNITIPKSVTRISAQLLYGCSSLESVTIPEGITSIGDSAFSFCKSLKTLTIPEGITSIGSNAFSDCSSLKTVNYMGSQADWERINIEEGNDPLTKAEITYNIPIN